jgi:uroporphyrin-III C-methyltransferase/precorrin-2 dehydrogenase/sirohydrochlorin ferrochelatase/uroporphyrin-III C-methyltransferase
MTITKFPKVYLVGAGPGDPDLLTIKALKRLQETDIVVYDRLVSNEILELIPKNVVCISVAKETGNHCVPQDGINEMLVELAQQGKKVVRLKGGDPYTFGRGAEEALFLKQAGIPFETIPGISAAIGCGAQAGIPLTHRGLANSVRFMTGHLQNNNVLDFDWSKVADPNCTLVIYMGLANLLLISKQLQLAGLAASTPAAAIHKGTTSEQQQVISTLKNLHEDVTRTNLKAPAMIIIGKVVALSEELADVKHLAQSHFVKGNTEGEGYEMSHQTHA